ASAALANAVPYMQAFGHVVLAWIWLDLMLTVPAEAAGRSAQQVGRYQAGRYFFRYELPRVAAWLPVVESRDPTCLEMPEDAF
ncbi:MAG: acyl-CoA dehydrogenase C-terminal domain-containing protein, partial [Arenimonas sp.]|nr:acyl-CoA dehydrogenase C-terminal domain-containing protein [Arenimonas sp.]